MKHQSKEHVVRTANGWLVLAITVGLLFTGAGLIIRFGILSEQRLDPSFLYLGGAAVAIAGAVFCCPGFFTLQPNNACVLTLFGSYKGTELESGFHWTNPFMKKMKITS